MNIFDLFHARIASILAGIQADGRLPPLDLSRFVVEPPKDAALGDLACNAAMVFAREAKEHFANPRMLATEICYALAQSEGVATAEGRKVTAMAIRSSVPARRPMSNTSPPTPRVRCMLATCAARCSAMRWPNCCSPPATT